MAAPVTEAVPTYVAKPTSANFAGKDGVYFHIKDDFGTVYSLSATENIEYSSPAAVTSNPVMSGEVTTDNIQLEPRIIKISGVVVPDIFVRLFYEKPRVSVESFINSVRQIRLDKKVVTVVAPHKMTLDQAFITKFAASKDKNIANGLKVTMEFQEILTREAIGQTTATVRPKEEGAGGKKDAGSTQTKDAKSGLPTDANSSCRSKLQLGDAPVKLGTSESAAYNDCLVNYKHVRGINGGKL
jgi:hypothetical protein